MVCFVCAANEESIDRLIRKAAKIGYEKNIKAALLAPSNCTEKLPEIDPADYKFHPDHYTIVDVRNWGEVSERKIFPNAISIPLPELRERISEIPADKPIVVHCAAGYRSAAAASIIANKIDSVPVYDLGEAVIEVGRQKSDVS